MNSKRLPLKTGNVLDVMESMYDCMTPSARRISDYVKENAENVIKLPIAELSQQVKVGEATIIRFCRLLGFRGFQDFKMDLAVGLSANSGKDKSILDTDIAEEDSIELIGQKLQQSINNVLFETLNLTNFKTLELVSLYIKSAKGVYFFGVGSSGLTAEDAKNKFMRIGFNVDALTSNHLMYMKASLLGESDLAIGISHSGTSKETVKALKLAQKAGAKTLALTHNPKSIICHYADFILLNGNKQGKMQGDSICTKLAQLFILDLLYIQLVKEDILGMTEKKHRTTQALGILE